MSAELAKCIFSIDATRATGVLNMFNKNLNDTSALAETTKAAISAIFTGSVIAGSKYFVDLASEAQETTQKFGVVFQSVSKQAEAAVKKLVETYNMSSHAARTALSDTGDLLSGFGFTGAAALDLAQKVNQLGSDLASFTNYAGGSKGAADALTKALLGEREQAKMLGIAISEEQVQAQIAADKKAGIVYQSLAHAKAYATYTIAVRQSTNAIGDAERSTESYAFNVRKLENNIDDLKRNIGAALIGPATKIARIMADTVGWFNKLNPAVVKYGTLTTVAGGLITGMSVAIFKVYNAISTYMIMSRVGAAATAYNTQQTAANTAASGANSQQVSTNTASVGANAQAVNTSSVSRASSTQAIEAHSLALERNTLAAQSNATANSMTGRNTQSGPGARAGAGVSPADAPYWARGRDYSSNTGRVIRTVRVPALAEGAVNPNFARYLRANREQTASRVSMLRQVDTNPKYMNIGRAVAGRAERNTMRYTGTGLRAIGNVSDLLSVRTWLPGLQGVFRLVGTAFTRFGGGLGRLVSLIWRPVAALGRFVGPTRIFGGVIARVAGAVAGFAVPFVGWGAAIVTGVMLIAKVLKNLPEYFETFRAELWPKIKEGMTYIVGKVADFLSPSNLWGLVKSGVSGIGNLFKAGQEGFKNTFVRMAGYDTEAAKAYSDNKLQKMFDEHKKRTEAAAKAEQELIEKRKVETEAMKKQFMTMNKSLLSKFATGSEEKKSERYKAIQEQQAKIDSFKKDEAQVKELNAQKEIAEKQIAQRIKENYGLKGQSGNEMSGEDRDKLNNQINENARVIEYQTYSIEQANKKLNALNVPAENIQKEFDKLNDLKAGHAIESIKENRVELKTKRDNYFERSILGKTGEDKTKALSDRVGVLKGVKDSDQETFKQQEEIRKKLRDMATNSKNKDVAELANAALDGNIDALNKLSEKYSETFSSLGAMITDSDLLENERAYVEAQQALRDQQAADRALTYKKQETADQKRINLSGGKLQIAENVYGDAKEKALAMNTGEFKTATAKYVTALNQAHNEEDLAIRHKIANINKEMEATTDAEKLADLEAEKMGLENDLQNSQREHNKKIKDTYKERDEIERERTERQKALKQNIQKSLDESLLKEAKTGRQRLSIYGGQYMRAMQEYRTAKNSEKKFEALGKVKEASDSINGEIEAMAKKQEERNKNVWTTAAPQKAVTAGSTEAYSIQNKLYNSFQRNVERNTKDMVGLNKRMIAELQTLNSQQQSEYTLDVKV